MLALERGLFGKRALEDIETDLNFESQQDPLVSKQPVFMLFQNNNKSKTPMNDRIPIRPERFNRPLQKLCQHVGLTGRVTFYQWRREFITAIVRNGGKAVALEFATHAPSTSADQKLLPYDYGFGDYNVTALRLGERGNVSAVSDE